MAIKREPREKSRWLGPKVKENRFRTALWPRKTKNASWLRDRRQPCRCSAVSKSTGRASLHSSQDLGDGVSCPWDRKYRPVQSGPLELGWGGPGRGRRNCCELKTPASTEGYDRRPSSPTLRGCSLEREKKEPIIINGPSGPIILTVGSEGRGGFGSAALHFRKRKDLVVNAAGGVSQGSAAAYHKMNCTKRNKRASLRSRSSWHKNEMQGRLT